MRMSIMYLTIWSENSKSVKVKKLGMIPIVIFRHKPECLVINLSLFKLVNLVDDSHRDNSSDRRQSAFLYQTSLLDMYLIG
jgi:hypothetical protein